MRLTPEHKTRIRDIVREQAGGDARVRVFGSRVDDERRGGDIDLLVEVPRVVDNPALLSARISARLTRRLDGRRVDVLLSAPNLRRNAIHRIAEEQGQSL